MIQRLGVELLEAQVEKLEAENAELRERAEAKEKADFMTAFDTVQQWAYRIAKMKGFHKKQRSPLEAIALVHSELSELLESFRKGTENEDSEHIPDFSQAEEEIADVIIRLMDMSEEFSNVDPGQPHDTSWRIGEAIVAKIRFNAKREKMHGGKLY